MLPAHQRIEKTLETISRLKGCDPPPSEILVHVADTQSEMISAVREAHPDVNLLLSDNNLGPGGARNRMLREACNEFVASFDDDSYPDDAAFFQDLEAWFDRLPEASILALNIYEGEEKPSSQDGHPREVAHFVGCGCAYRRTHFLEGEGYVPIPIAYSMEEADLALRYRNRGRCIWYVPALRVYHDTVLSHHASPAVAAMQVANTMLFVYLRYPPRYWLLGVAQVLHKWVDTLKRRRWKGALLALPFSVSQLFRYRKYRQTVSPQTFNRQRQLARE
jgi:GT2 family glycosyltransferase